MSDPNKFTTYFDMNKPHSISIVGAGGKTSVMYRLADELKVNNKVITTTTTRIRKPSQDQSNRLFLESETDNLLDTIEAALERHRHITIAKGISEEQKLIGCTPATIDQLKSLSCHMIVEADGAFNKSIKAPKKYEPVIPESTDIVISVIGADALGKKLNKDIAFRLGRMQKVTGINKNDQLTAAAVSNLVFHPKGSFKGAPDGAEKWLVINKANVSKKAMNAAMELAQTIYLIDHPNKPDKIFITSLQPEVEIHMVLEKP